MNDTRMIAYCELVVTRAEMLHKRVTYCISCLRNTKPLGFGWVAVAEDKSILTLPSMSDTTANDDNPDPEAPNDNNKTNTENRSGKKKLIRLLTVLAYVCAVSMAAVVLSLYYIFLWTPKSESRSMALTAPCIACQYIPSKCFTFCIRVITVYSKSKY